MRIKVHILFKEDATEDDIESFILRFNMYYVAYRKAIHVLSGTILKEDMPTLEAIPLVDSVIEDEPGMEAMIAEIHRRKRKKVT